MKKLKIVEYTEDRNITEAGYGDMKPDPTSHRIHAILDLDGANFTVHSLGEKNSEALSNFLRENTIFSTLDVLNDNKDRVKEDATLLKDICYGLSKDAGWH